MDLREQSAEPRARHVAEDVERDARVEGAVGQLELEEVGLDDAGSAGDEIDAGHLEWSQLRLAHAAAELEDARVRRELRDEQLGPLVARVADDPSAPLVEVRLVPVPLANSISLIRSARLSAPRPLPRARAPRGSSSPRAIT